jgi:hypothetical protein
MHRAFAHLFALLVVLRGDAVLAQAEQKLEDIHACLRYAIALVASEDIHLSPAAA